MRDEVKNNRVGLPGHREAGINPDIVLHPLSIILHT